MPSLQLRLNWFGQVIDAYDQPIPVQDPVAAKKHVELMLSFKYEGKVSIACDAPDDMLTVQCFSLLVDAGLLWQDMLAAAKHAKNVNKS